MKALISILTATLIAMPLFAENAAKPIGDPVLEPATLHCLGAYWVIQGDDNKNAKIEVEYHRPGDAWSKSMPLFRVEKGAHKAEKYGSKIKVPDDAWLFAGSVVLLAPDTPYELRLKLSDPDGGSAEKVLQCKTIAESVAPANMTQKHVAPGNGGGSGTAADPFKGLAAAEASAKPGDLFLVHAGTYSGAFNVKHSGEPGKPIIWRGAGDGEAIVDCGSAEKKKNSRSIAASDAHDIWFENLTACNATYGISGNRSARLVIRRCHIHNCDYGIACTDNDADTMTGDFFSDNIIEGPSVWPRSKGIENARGIQITGTGHVICYNRIRGFADALDTFGSPRCAAIDFHNNEISECTDDGIEMDYSERNTRCFLNRFTNCYQGISVQPVFGGPVYIFRNALYNVCAEPFKMHNSPSGALMFHNTCVKKGTPLSVSTEEKIRNCVYRNNLFIGTEGGYAYECMPPTIDCDYDYDGFGGGPFNMFLKWNGARYKTMDEVKARAPIYKHIVAVDPATSFASGVKQPSNEKEQQQISMNDLRLKAGTAAIDAGEVLPGFNDGFSGKAPDLGAYELGEELPHYGPRK